MTDVLDHGYVRHIETWGSDERIIEAARMSTDKGFQGWGPVKCAACSGIGRGTPNDYVETTEDYTIRQCIKCRGSGTVEGDEKLLRYLYQHHHDSPFEFAGMVIEVQAPIAVFREWHRHRTQSYNEMSGRYTKLPDLYYVPSVERLMAGKQAVGNKQSSAEGFTEAEATAFQRVMVDVYAGTRGFYEGLLEAGVSREVARFILPVGQYSRMRASANLRNWLAFLTLRMDPSAQWEIRQYATLVGQIIATQFPRTWALFVENL